MFEAIGYYSLYWKVTMTLLKLQRQEVATKLFEAHREAPPVSQPVRTVFGSG